MEFYQLTKQTYPPIPIGKKIIKFQMCRKVITDGGDIWQYDFGSNGIQWTYECNVHIEVNKNK